MPMTGDVLSFKLIKLENAIKIKGNYIQDLDINLLDAHEIETTATLGLNGITLTCSFVHNAEEQTKRYFVPLTRIKYIELLD